MTTRKTPSKDQSESTKGASKGKRPAPEPDLSTLKIHHRIPYLLPLQLLVEGLRSHPRTKLIRLFLDKTTADYSELVVRIVDRTKSVEKGGFSQSIFPITRESNSTLNLFVNQWYNTIGQDLVPDEEAAREKCMVLMEDGNDFCLADLRKAYLKDLKLGRVPRGYPVPESLLQPTRTLPDEEVEQEHGRETKEPSKESPKRPLKKHKPAVAAIEAPHPVPLPVPATVSDPFAEFLRQSNFQKEEMTKAVERFFSIVYKHPMATLDQALTMLDDTLASLCFEKASNTQPTVRVEQLPSSPQPPSQDEFVEEKGIVE